MLKIIRNGDEATVVGPKYGQLPNATLAPTAQELLEIERSRTPITTFSSNLDGLLAGNSAYSSVQKVGIAVHVYGSWSRLL